MNTALVVDDERFFLTILGDLVSQRLGMRPLLAREGAAEADGRSCTGRGWSSWGSKRAPPS
jgi:hypothetical protein